MKQLNANTTTLHTSASPDAIFAPVQTAIASDYGAYIGLDVHKDTIAIAIAEPGREAPIYEGEIAHTPKKVTRLLTRDRKSTRLNSSHVSISYAVFCLKKK